MRPREENASESRSSRRLRFRGKRPAGPIGWPLIGSAPEIARTPLGFPERCFREYGDVVRFRLAGRPPCYFFFHPADVDEVLSVKHRSFHRTSVVRGLFVNDLFAAEGEAWRKRRRILSGPLAPSEIRTYAETIVNIADDFVSSFQDAPRTIDVHRETLALSLRVVARTLYGFDLETLSERLEKALLELRALYYPLFLGWQSLLPEWLPTRGRKRLTNLMNEVDGIGMDMIAAARRDPGGRCLLARLMAARFEDGSAMSERQLCDEALTLIAASYETTGLALANIMALLARNPSVLATAREELDRVLGDRSLTADDAERLPYLIAIVHEALRLYPSGPVFGRRAIADVEIGGIPIRRGEDVWVHLWITQRDARWFPEPAEFRPERWLDGARERLPRGAYLPFGAGPRSCPGSHFATLELLLCTAAIVKRLDLTSASGNSPDGEVTHGVFLQPATPILVHASMRQSPRSVRAISS